MRNKNNSLFCITFLFFLCVLSASVPTETAMASDDVIVDFGVSGTWVLSDGTDWSKLHPGSPESIVTGEMDGNRQGDLIADFGPSGLWVYYNNASWSQIHPLNPRILARGDIDGNTKDDVIVDFGAGIGIWMYQNDISWTNLHSASAESIETGDMDGDGKDDVIIDFGPSGIWVWKNNVSWMKLHALSPEIMKTADMDGDGKDDVILDFGFPGIWVWKNNASWEKLHPMSAEIIETGDLDGNGREEVIFDFGFGSGMWVWQNDGQWEKLHVLTTEFITVGDIDGNGKDDVLLDFGSSFGLWVWYDSAQWEKLHGMSPEIMACSDMQGSPGMIAIDIPPYSVADFKAYPGGGGFIVGGHIIIDFEDALSVDEIDGILAANNLERVGLIEGVNQVTAKILDGRTESQVKTAMSSASGVETVVLNIILESSAASFAGSFKPIHSDNEGVEFLSNWHHYVMETFPALALADAVIGNKNPSDVVLVILDTGGFQIPSWDSTDVILGKKPEWSLLYKPASDTDLATKVVAPTGIEIKIDPDTKQLTGVLRSGPVDRTSNHLIGAGATTEINDVRTLHGLAVASAAVGNGQDILGTGRHVKFQPIKISQNGFCAQDPATICSSEFDCISSEGNKGPCAMAFCTENKDTPCIHIRDSANDECKAQNKGTCQTIIDLVPTDWFLAALSAVSNEQDIADNNDYRVMNISMGYPKDLVLSNIQIEEAAAILRPHLEKYIQGDRIVVISAGNEKDNTTTRMPAALGPPRGIDRRSPETHLIHRGTMIVAATAYADLITTEDDRERFAEDFSNYGSNVSVSAPGEVVPVLKGDLEGVRSTDGTSFSAPYVAGLAAEMFALDPQAKNVDIIEIIEETADAIESQKPNHYIGHGRINAWKAILTLLNRNEPADKPKWLGIRYRSAVTFPPDQFRVNGRLVPDVHLKRVLNIDQDLEDNIREVHFPFDLDTFQMATQFSLNTSELESSTGDIVLLEGLDEEGNIIYQIPAILEDLLNLKPLDTSLDDHIITFDIQTEIAAIYGSVKSSGSPVPQATVRYTAKVIDASGNETTAEKEVLTDRHGLYVIYDAVPDAEFQISATASGHNGDAYDIVAPKFRATQQDFMLDVPIFNRIAFGVRVIGHFDDPNFVDRERHIANARPCIGSVGSRSFSCSYTWNPAGSTVSGSITGTLNDQGDLITSLTFSEQWTGPNGTGSKEAATLKDVPLYDGNRGLVNGTDVCIPDRYIVELTDEFTTTTRTTKMISHSCVHSSSIGVYFSIN